MIPSPMKELIESFRETETPTEQFELFIELASELPVFAVSDKCEAYKIHGCASNAWVKAELSKGNILLSADAEAVISKGFLAFFVLGFSGWTAKQICEFDPQILQTEGIISSLSPSRSNGALASLKKIQDQCSKMLVQ